jgi:hypothetical protein
LEGIKAAGGRVSERLALWLEAKRIFDRAFAR